MQEDLNYGLHREQVVNGEMSVNAREGCKRLCRDCKMIVSCMMCFVE